jgi:hypothetical protein
MSAGQARLAVRLHEGQKALARSRGVDYASADGGLMRGVSLAQRDALRASSFPNTGHWRLHRNKIAHPSVLSDVTELAAIAEAPFRH